MWNFKKNANGLFTEKHEIIYTLHLMEHYYESRYLQENETHMFFNISTTSWKFKITNTSFIVLLQEQTKIFQHERQFWTNI